MNKLMDSLRDGMDKACSWMERAGTEISCATSTGILEGSITTTGIISKVKVQFKTPKIVESYGFVLYNELKNRIENKKVLLDSGVVKIVYDEYSTMELYTDGKTINVKMGNMNYNFKYDYKRIVESIVMDKPIKEFGDIAEEDESINIDKVVASNVQKQNPSPNNQTNQQQSITPEQPVQDSIFEGGDGISDNVLNEMDQIIRDTANSEKINNDLESMVSNHGEGDNVFVESARIINESINNHLDSYYMSYGF